MAKIQTYKFVNPGGAKTASSAVTAARTQTLAFNRLGSTVSSIGVVVSDLEKIALLRIKDDKKRAILERRRKQREADAAAEEAQELNKVKKGKVTSEGKTKTKRLIRKKNSPFGWVSSFLQPIGNILMNIGMFAITKETLEWFSDEENITKLVTFLEKAQFVFGKLFGWASGFTQNILDGFSALVDPEGDFITRLGGLGTLMTGIIGLKYLMNPFSLITDILGLVDLLGGAGDKPRRTKPKGDGDSPRTKPTTQNPSGADPDLDGPRGRVKASTVADQFGEAAAKQYKKILAEYGDDAARAYANALSNSGGDAAKALKAWKRLNLKPIKPPKPGVFQRAGNFFGGVFDAGVDLTKKGLGQLHRGLKGLPAWAGEQYNSLSKAAKAGWENTVKAGEAIASKGKSWASAAGDKFNSAKNWVTDGGKAFLNKMATGTKNFVLQKVIDPLRPIIDPIGKKAAQIGQALMDLLMKIPGIDKGLEILKKKGIGSFGDIAQAGSKLGKRAAAILPVVGGLVNLAFAYERAASGDSIGALIEGTSGILDVFGLATGGATSVLSMLMDGYMFVRDFVPQLQEGEEAVVDKVGARGLKDGIDNVLSKLPNIGEIINFIMGNKNEEDQRSDGESKTDPNAEQPMFLGGLVKGAKKAFSGVKNVVGKIASNPLVQTAASFIPGAAPIMAGINMFAGGNPMSALGMIPGMGSITGAFSNFMQGPLGQIGSSLLGGNFGSALSTGLGMINPGLGQMAGGFLSGGFNPMDMVNNLADQFGMSGIFKSMVGGATNEIASTLGVQPEMISGAVDSGKQMLSGEKSFSAQYAMQQVLEFVPVPMIIDKLVPIPTAVPINNSQPIVTGVTTALTQRQQ